MKNRLAMVALALVAGPAIVPTTGLAAATSNHLYHRGHYYHRSHCGGGNGAVGTVAGGVGGAVIGHAIIGGPVGLVAGAVGGGLLGRHLDKTHTRHRRGC
jgi:hypothetical protein